MKTTLLCAFLLVSNLTYAQANYQATIEDAKSAALEVINKKEATALSIALVGPDGVIWSQAFGIANPLNGTNASESTLFGIGSVSKLLATMAVMKLVDQGLVELDKPLVDYVPNFRMKSPEYKKITVRMLLNHSAGLPGADYRNAFTSKTYHGYLDQVLKTLSESRLKAPPGFMNVYCNDCFTLVEALVLARTGKHYADFIKDEFLIPLGMTNTSYPTRAFADNSYAKTVKNGQVMPQEFINCLASGGVYSTAKDFAKVAQLFLNKGKVGTTSLLSPTSIEEMAKDQTIGTFNPVKNTSFTYGLGWDTVVQPGLAAVGFDGWSKGGDTPGYGAEILVSPKAQLGVVVLGVNNFGSEKAKTIAERILLHALVDKHLIPAMPAKIEAPSVIPAVDTTPANQSIFAMHNYLMNLTKQDKGFNLAFYTDKGWDSYLDLQPQKEGWFINATMPYSEFKVLEANSLGLKNQYLIRRGPMGYGHYVDSSIYAQALYEPKKPLSAAWKNRLHETWLVVNANNDEPIWNELEPDLRIKVVPGFPNLITVRPPLDSSYHVLDPSKSDSEANMMLIIPQLNGRDLNDLVVVKQGNQEWMRFGSYLHQPLSTSPVLAMNKPKTMTIGSEGYAKWLVVKDQPFQRRVKINTNGDWVLYGSNFKLQQKGKGNSVLTIPANSGVNYLTLLGEKGSRIRVEAKKMAAKN